MTTGEKIRRARKNQRVTQRDLADALGIDHTYISHVERGRTPPSLEFIERVARALGVPVAVLLVAPTVIRREDGRYNVKIRAINNVVMPNELRALRDAIDAALGDAKPCDVCELCVGRAACDGWTG